MFFFQVGLTLEGKAPAPQHLPLSERTETIAADTGPASVAVSSPSLTKIFPLSGNHPDLLLLDQQIRQCQRNIDRLRRQNNPANFNTDQRRRGQKLETVSVLVPKKSRLPFVCSAEEARLRSKRRDLCRRREETLTRFHQELANTILGSACRLVLEKTDYRQWKKLYSKSMQKHAPGKFHRILVARAEQLGIIVIEVNPFSTAFSQYCHYCNDTEKLPLEPESMALHKRIREKRGHKIKTLSDRVHVCPRHLNENWHRDLYSALLMEHCSKTSSGSYVVDNAGVQARLVAQPEAYRPPSVPARKKEAKIKTKMSPKNMRKKLRRKKQVDQQWRADGRLTQPVCINTVIASGL